MSTDISCGRSNGHVVKACVFYLTAHLGVSCHDGVVAVIVERGRRCVQGAGPIGLSADPVVLAPLGDLLAVFEPVDLQYIRNDQT